MRRALAVVGWLLVGGACDSVPDHSGARVVPSSVEPRAGPVLAASRGAEGAGESEHPHGAEGSRGSEHPHGAEGAGESEHPRVVEAALARPVWQDGHGAPIEADHWLPGPARRGEDARDPAARLVLDQGCRRCHARAAHEWSESQHAGSWSSRAFQRAFAVESRAFCQHCHAPEEDPAIAVGEVSPAAAALGVACVTCHVPPGATEVWAAPRPDAAAVQARSPHAIARGPAYAGPQACARCHEFDFPDAALRTHPLAMQRTITEHRASAASRRSCAECHMPRDDAGRRTHAYAGAYDPAMLARALIVRATRPEPTTVSVRLAPGEVGHAVPTGDLLRRLEVSVEIEGTPDEPPFTARRYFGRRFGPIHQANGLTLRGERADERVGVGAEGGVREATFELPAALADQPVRWRVAHQRVALASRDARRAPIEGELPVASGILPPS